MNQIGLFAKFWQPGEVKTRLAASIGADAACKVYHAFVTHLVKQLAPIADNRWIAFSPQDKESEFRNEVPDSWKLCPQSQGDLGLRMETFFRERMNESSAPRKVVVIGADCPQLQPAEIQSTFDLLDETPVVIGPSTDGGYYLVAMRDSCFEIFDDISWSTETVLSDTLGKLDSLGVGYSLLSPLTDVDELKSLVSLKTHLESRTAENGNQADAELLSKIDAALAQGSGLGSQ